MKTEVMVEVYEQLGAIQQPHEVYEKLTAALQRLKGPQRGNGIFADHATGLRTEINTLLVALRAADAQLDAALLHVHAALLKYEVAFTKAARLQPSLDAMAQYIGDPSVKEGEQDVA